MDNFFSSLRQDCAIVWKNFMIVFTRSFSDLSDELLLGKWQWGILRLLPLVAAYSRYEDWQF